MFSRVLRLFAVLQWDARNVRAPETWKNGNKTNRVDGAYSNEKLLNLKLTFTFFTLFTHFLHERGEQ